MSTKKSEETIVDVAEVYSKTESFINDNGRKLTYLIFGIIAVIFAFFLYKKFVQEPKSKAAAAEIWKAEYYLEKDSLDLALNGDGEYLGFEDIAMDYPGTPTGNLANHYAGVCYIQKGDYATGINYLEKASFSDMMAEATRLGALGDAHVQSGDLATGASFYSKAISHSDNEFTAPIYLKKLALTYEELGEKGKAYDAFVRLKNEYANASVSRDIDKYIGRVSPFVN